MKKLLLFAYCIVFSTLTAWSQQRTVTGKVTGEDGSPLPGVSVVVEGTTIGAQTDLDGVYELVVPVDAETLVRSEEHTSELQSLMRISYAVFCLKKKKKIEKQKTS